MSNISPEQKLELIRSIRMQNQYNRNQCRERERFLYGYASTTKETGRELYGAEITAALNPKMMVSSDEYKDTSVFKSFRIRFLIAVIIIGLFIFFDKSNTSFFRISVEEIATYLSTTTELKETFNSFDL